MCGWWNEHLNACLFSVLLWFATLVRYSRTIVRSVSSHLQTVHNEKNPTHLDDLEKHLEIVFKYWRNLWKKELL